MSHEEAENEEYFIPSVLYVQQYTVSLIYIEKVMLASYNKTTEKNLNKYLFTCSSWLIGFKTFKFLTIITRVLWGVGTRISEFR